MLFGETDLYRENIADHPQQFVKMRQRCINMTVARLIANVTVAYPVQLVSINFTKQIRQFLTEYFHTLIALYPAATAETSLYVRDCVTALQ